MVGDQKLEGWHLQGIQSFRQARIREPAQHHRVGGLAPDEGYRLVWFF